MQPTNHPSNTAYTTQTSLQASLAQALRPATPTGPRAAAAAAGIRRVARQDGAFAKRMREHAIDVVLSASDAELVSFSACAGWPAATVPVGNLGGGDGQPWGSFALARDGEVGLLVRLMEGFYGGFEGVEGPTRPFEEDGVRE